LGKQICNDSDGSTNWDSGQRGVLGNYPHVRSLREHPDFVALMNELRRNYA
jgi:hypothetical protein